MVKPQRKGLDFANRIPVAAGTRERYVALATMRSAMDQPELQPVPLTRDQEKDMRDIEGILPFDTLVLLRQV